MTFNELNLTAPLLKAVGEAGYTEPSPIQAKAIPPVLAGRDLLGCAQTGTGKTAAFALPMLQNLTARKPRKPGAIRALILTPTRELALQIGQSFADYGKYEKLRHTVIFGGVGQQPQVNALKRGVDILVACPGRLNDLIGQGYIDLANVEIFVLDEADRMLDMGFIHDVKKVIAKLPPKTARQTLLFSATMPKEIEQLADSLLNDPDTVKVNPVSSTVDRIAQSLYYVEKGNKKLLLSYLIKTLDPPVANALVFSRTKHGADKIVKDLEKDGITAAAIHGNKSQNARVAALDGFKAGKTQVLVATDIAARGIDINELAYVFNYDLPEVPETYVHRIGRTARAGADGNAVSFCSPEEAEYLAGIEKLNRKKIPVVSGHPWDGVPAPKKILPPLRGRRPAAAPVGPKAAAPTKQQPRAPKIARDVQNKPDRKEELLMEEKDKQAAQGENAPNGAKRRRRHRGKGHGAGQQGTPQQGGQNSMPPRAPSAGSNAQPRFDPHFLTPQAANQANRAPQQSAQAPRGRNDARPQQNGPRQGFGQGRPNNGPRPQNGMNRQNPAPNGISRQNNAQNAPRPAEQGRHAQAKAPAQPAKDEDPGLLLIARRAPQQKFTSFDDYMNAHGGATAPIEDQTSHEN
ncbi:MAG: DEAD/DEAH box helicase [Faecalibacterium sp.]|jgi:ATP-dependent RNA helicase RhlE|nr:DEAD/DEAH box helicase [Faecalibacterium sp.]